MFLIWVKHIHMHIYCKNVLDISLKWLTAALFISGSVRPSTVDGHAIKEEQAGLM